MKVSTLQKGLVACATLALVSAFVGDEVGVLDGARDGARVSLSPTSNEESRTDQLEDAGAPHNGACWQYRYEAGRFKRTYVCD